METVFNFLKNLSRKYERDESLYNAITLDCNFIYLLKCLVKPVLPPFDKWPISFKRDVLAKMK